MKVKPVYWIALGLALALTACLYELIWIQHHLHHIIENLQ